MKSSQNVENKHPSEESLKLLPFEGTSWHTASSQQAIPKKLLIANLVLFTFSLVILVIAFLSTSRFTCTSCPRELAWSPVLDAVPVRKVKFNETFGFPSTYPSKFQGAPNEDVDREWERFTKHAMLDRRLGHLGVPLPAIAKLEKATDPDWMASLVRLGERGDKYMVNLETFHIAHCLNMLRKVIYPEYYKPYGKAERGHLEHCVETVRQALMCNSGTGLVNFHWVGGMEEPYSDYNTYHQCRDPDAFWDWAVQNAVLVPLGGTKRKSGQKELLTHPE